MKLGKADCDNCSLGKALAKSAEWVPVETERHTDDRVVLLGEAPGGHEVMEGRPFVGPSGIELQGALDAAGVRRDECRIVNVIACRPPENKLSNFLTRASRANKKRENPLLMPQVACRERMLEDIRGFDRVICLGAEAARAMRGGHVSIMGVRGGCEVVQMPWGPVKVAYALHPAFVLRSPKWREVFHKDVGRAFRFFEDKLDWEDPEIQIVKSAHELEQAIVRLKESKAIIAYDVETDALNPLTANLRCVAIGSDKLSIVVPLLGIDGHTRFFGVDEETKVVGLLKHFLLHPDPCKLIGHNAGQYDRLACEQALGIRPALSADTLILHLLADNEMPHRLGFVGSFYTDFTESWKADHTAVEAKSDEELHIYCAKDAAITAMVAPPLARVVSGRSQGHLLEWEHKLQEVGCNMQKLGMFVDREKLAEHQEAFTVLLAKHRRTCAEILSDEFNPASTHQLRRVLFTEWKLPPVKYNEKTGDPSTDDDTLRRMLTDYQLDEERKALIQAVRMVRRYGKLLSTYLRPLAGDLVLADGRVHPSYNRLPATGRYSSSAPNAQNIPAFLRDIFVPEPGRVFVGADMDQLELRLIAEEAGAQRLLDSFASGADPHNDTMEIVYGPGIWGLEGAPKDRKKKGEKKSVFDRTRGITKSVRYAWQYAAHVPTIHEQVISVEDDEGKLIYAHMTTRDIRSVVQGLNRADPEIPKWWDLMRNLYRRQHYIADTLWLRRRDFKDEEKINEIVNHPIQAGGASIVHEAMLDLVAANGFRDIAATKSSFPCEEIIPFDYVGRTGLINQCHDSLLFEVPEDKAEDVKNRVQAAMTRRRRENPLIDYTAEAKIGMSWLEV